MHKWITPLLIVLTQLCSVSAFAQAEFRGIRHIAGDLYQVQDDNNTFTALLVTPEGIILTDPINRRTATWLKAELKERFDLPVKYLIYSHNHDGHSSGADVYDEAIRDLDAIRGGTTPIFAAGVSHRGPYKDGPGEGNVPIALHGMIVSPGDIIVGDLDGVLCVPTDDAEAVIELALAQVDREKKTLEAIAGEGWDRGWVDEILRARGCSLD